MVHTAMEEVVEATCSMISTTAFGPIERDLLQECLFVFVIIFCPSDEGCSRCGPSKPLLGGAWLTKSGIKKMLSEIAPLFLIAHYIMYKTPKFSINQTNGLVV